MRKRAVPLSWGVTAHLSTGHGGADESAPSRAAARFSHGHIGRADARPSHGCGTFSHGCNGVTRRRTLPGGGSLFPRAHWPSRRSALPGVFSRRYAFPTGKLAEHPPSLKLRRDKDAQPSHGGGTLFPRRRRRGRSRTLLGVFPRRHVFQWAHWPSGRSALPLTNH